MIATQLESTARALVSSGRGILAADESDPTIGRRFSALGIENTAESRRVYRQMMFTTTGVAEFISGVILFDETIRQQAQPALLVVVGEELGVLVERLVEGQLLLLECREHRLAARLRRRPRVCSRRAPRSGRR